MRCAPQQRVGQCFGRFGAGPFRVPVGHRLGALGVRLVRPRLGLANRDPKVQDQGLDL